MPELTAKLASLTDLFVACSLVLGIILFRLATQPLPAHDYKVSLPARMHCSCTNWPCLLPCVVCDRPTPRCATGTVLL